MESGFFKPRCEPPPLHFSPAKSMSNIISFIGLRSGVGNSALVRTFAVEAAASLECLVVDFDTSPTSTYEWTLRRDQRGLKPSIPVERQATADLSAQRRGVELIMVDASNCSDQQAMDLARISRVVVMSSTTEEADLALVIRAARVFSDAGLGHRIVVALCRVQFHRDVAAAREMLAANGLKVLAGEIRADMASYPQLEHGGRALCESRAQLLSEGASVVVDAIQKAFVDGIEETFP